MKSKQIILTVCNFCGKSNVFNHTNYKDRCVDCGKRYIKYTNYKRLQKEAPTAARAAALQKVIEEYQILAQRGCKVPRDLNDIGHLADAALYKCDSATDQKFLTGNCIKLEVCQFCGAISADAHPKYTDRCVDCGKRYAKYSNYKSLQKSKPTVKRQALLEDIVTEYRMLERQGYKVPRDIREMR